MKLPFSWLKDHLETELSVFHVAEALTMLGLEVERIDDQISRLGSFVIGEIVSCISHPQANRLRICHVRIGQEETAQVVCGAPNARLGLKSVFAPPGTYIPALGTDLKIAKIRGITSHGMLCSERDLSLSNNHDRIIEAPHDLEPGQSFATATSQADDVIDLAITPNRGDCLSIYGIARDLAAAGMGRIKASVAPVVSGSYKSPVSVYYDDNSAIMEACPIFVGRHFRGLCNGASPSWLANRLYLVGLKPISRLVDITNYFTIDHGRPLHVFDAHSLQGDIIIRFGRKEESLRALDGQNYALDEETIVIADQARALALGGIIGGKESSVHETSTDIFLELALFDPGYITRSVRKFGLNSEASRRFERGLDPAFVFEALDRVSDMILELCGGEASQPVIVGELPDWRRYCDLSLDRVRSLVGLDCSAERQMSILHALGCKTKMMDNNSLRVWPPSWRHDIQASVDCVEEIARIIGYDSIEPISLPQPANRFLGPARSPHQVRRGAIARSLAMRGLTEAMTFSFLPEAQARLFGGAPRLLNPISSERNALRPSLLPNLLKTVCCGHERGVKRIALFEIGTTFTHLCPEGQVVRVAAVRSGTRAKHWSGPQEVIDAFLAKTDAFAALTASKLDTKAIRIQSPAADWYHPGRSGCIMLGDVRLADFGEIHPRYLAELDLSGPVAAFELNLDALPEESETISQCPPLQLSPFQSVDRDFAFLVDEAVPAQDLLGAVGKVKSNLIENVTIFDIHRGHGVPSGQKSIAVSITLRSPYQTLTRAEIEATNDQIIAEVAHHCGGRLRS